MTTIVAGIGNIFFSDDGFGSEVAQRLLAADAPMPDDVRVVDYGIRGMHLALDLLEGCDLLILVDAMARGEAPGTLTLLEPDPTGPGADPLDAHRMDPQAVLGMVADMGGIIGRVLVVGCEPEQIEDGLGLSDAVNAAIEPAVRMIADLIAERNTSCSVA